MAALLSSGLAYGDELTHTVEFFEEDLSFLKSDGFDQVLLKGCGAFSDPGRPVIPIKEFRLGLPTGLGAVNVRVSDIDSVTLTGSYRLLPATHARRIGDADDDHDITMDRSVYESPDPYPSEIASLVANADYAGRNLVTLTVAPLRYYPAEGKIVFFRSITLTVECKAVVTAGESIPRRASSLSVDTRRAVLKGIVDNPESIELNEVYVSQEASNLPSASIDQLTVTTSDLFMSFHPLVDWHTKKGIKDTLIDITWVLANYSGDDTEKLRAFLIDAYQEWGVSSVLLAGESDVIPIRYDMYADETAASDQYYSDFDDDWVHELMVGRVTPKTPDEAATFVFKVIEFERSPSGSDYARNALFIGMNLDSATPCEDLKEDIAGFLPGQIDLNRVYDSQDSNHLEDATAALNGGCQLVNHADHSAEGWIGVGQKNHGWRLEGSDIRALSNAGEYSIIISNGCHNVHTDDLDCVGEEFILGNSTGGAVAFAGNTRSGFYYSGNALSLSNMVEREWWVQLFDGGPTTLGRVFYDAKNNSPMSSSMEKQCLWSFNLLGDPSMPIWTDDPRSFNVQCPDTIDVGSNSVSVRVMDPETSQPVEGAQVCLMKQCEIFLTSLTDGSGNAYFEFDPAEAGLVCVTATGTNRIPSEEFIHVGEFVCGDVNSSGKPDIDDVNYLINYIFLEGPPPIIIESADVNCSGGVDIDDLVYLIAYLFVGGPEPCRDC